MSTPVITFFNNKGGVGKTSLVYHLSWMFAEMGQQVLALDLDPQANLTAPFLDKDQIKHYRSLMPLAQEARKPIFKLTPAEGAIGSHAVAVRESFTDFQILAREIQSKMTVQSLLALNS